MKIAVSPEYDHEKRLFHSNRLILILLQKELTALSDTFFNFGGYTLTVKRNCQLNQYAICQRFADDILTLDMKILD